MSVPVPIPSLRSSLTDHLLQQDAVVWTLVYEVQLARRHLGLHIHALSKLTLL
jgi:hypothetical protein